ncbi:MAG: hypothetical protein RMJ44_07275 [Cytophagales bacterium]|nr:hypothetical protein [Cytophagales bacterium]
MSQNTPFSKRWIATFKPCNRKVYLIESEHSLQQEMDCKKMSRSSRLMPQGQSIPCF